MFGNGGSSVQRGKIALAPIVLGNSSEGRSEARVCHDGDGQTVRETRLDGHQLQLQVEVEVGGRL